MTKSIALATLKSLLLEKKDLKSKINPSDLVESHIFVRDLGFDSIAVVSLFYELQDRWPELSEAEALKWVSVEDCVNALVKVSNDSLK